MYILSVYSAYQTHTTGRQYTENSNWYTPHLLDLRLICFPKTSPSQWINKHKTNILSTRGFILYSLKTKPAAFGLCSVWYKMSFSSGKANAIIQEHCEGLFSIIVLFTMIKRVHYRTSRILKFLGHAQFATNTLR